MFRKILLATIFTAGASASALAGDWTSFYVGINGGYGGGNSSYSYDETYPAGFSTVTVQGAARQKSNGFLGGGQVGYNYFCPPGWLLGIEADLDWSNIQSDNSILDPKLKTGFSPPQFSSKLDYLATARARLGYAVGRDVLVYATGGVAQARVSPQVDIDLTPPSPVPPPAYVSTVKSATRRGWTAGAGMELPLSGKLTFKAEYLYADLGRYQFINGPVPVVALFGGYANGQLKGDLKTTANIVRVGFNYALD